MIVYTVITNDYDTLLEPVVVTPGWRYVCFSDKPIRSKVWEFHAIENTSGSDRWVKIQGHKFFNEPTLYIDGRFLITGDLPAFVEKIKGKFSLPVHSRRSCLYQEAKVLISRGIWGNEQIEEQMSRYRQDGFPTNYGLGTNGILLRDLSNPRVQAINEMWWEEWERGAKRDQLSLMYCFWKKRWQPTFFLKTWYRECLKLKKHNEESKEKILVVD